MDTIASLGSGILPFLIVLTPLVFVHEFGHYLIARLNGVRIETFSIGFGPEIAGFNDRHGTRWKFSAFPLGGFVKMFGEQPEADAEAPPLNEADKAVSFHHKTVRQRAAIVVAGPAANFLFAAVLFFGLFAAIGVPALKAQIGAVLPDSAAAVAGFQPGDRVTAINGEPVEWFEDFRQIVSTSPGKQLVFSVVRDGGEIPIDATPRPTTAASGEEIGLLGVNPDPGQVGYQHVSVVGAALTAVERVVGMTGQILSYLWQMVSGQRSSDELGGPIRIAVMSNEVWQGGMANVVLFIAAMSINLGLINLLPIPVLDGGHLLFYAAEAVRGKPIGQRLQEYGLRIGLALILCIMVFATWNDISSLKVFDLLREWVG